MEAVEEAEELEEVALGEADSEAEVEEDSSNGIWARQIKFLKWVSSSTLWKTRCYALRLCPKRSLISTPRYI